MSTGSRRPLKSVSRPEKKAFTQNVPKGISTLLGDAEEDAPTTGEKESEETAPSPMKRKNSDKEEDVSRVTFSLRYKVEYRDKLDKLYLQERLKGNRVQKVDLVEEALDLLFEKYGL